MDALYQLSYLGEQHLNILTEFLYFFNFERFTLNVPKTATVARKSFSKRCAVDGI